MPTAAAVAAASGNTITGGAQALLAAAAHAAAGAGADAKTTAATTTKPSDADLTQALRALLAAHPLAKTKCSITAAVATGNDGTTVLTISGSIPVRPYGSAFNLLIDHFVTRHAPHIARVVRDVNFTVPPKRLDGLNNGDGKDAAAAAGAGAGAGTGPKLGVSDAELTQYFDTDDELRRKIAWLSARTKSAKHLVVYTGAGLSTAAAIPDFRGPSGVWTARDRGLAAPASIALEHAQPTFAHRALNALRVAQHLKYTTTQNIDGLTRRSGIPAAELSELHGSAFVEVCSNDKCNASFERDFDVTVKKGDHFFAAAKDPFSTESGMSHLTGRKCDKCQTGLLRDSIIHFGENLPVPPLERAIEHATRSDLSVCIGSSLHVRPACDLPQYSAKNDTKGMGAMAIVNLQSTGKDSACLASGGILIHAKADKVLRLWTTALGLDVPISEAEKLAAEQEAPALAPVANPSAAAAAGGTAASGAASSFPSPAAQAAAAASPHAHFSRGVAGAFGSAAASPLAALAKQFGAPTGAGAAHTRSLLVDGKAYAADVTHVVAPAAPSQTVHFLNCKAVDSASAKPAVHTAVSVHLRGRCAKLILENCTGMHVFVSGPLLASSVEIIRCNDLTLQLACTAHTLTVDTTASFKLHAWRADLLHRVVLTADCSGMHVAIGSGVAPSAAAAEGKAAVTAADGKAPADGNAGAAASPAPDFKAVGNPLLKWPTASATDQYLVEFDAFGNPALEPLVRRGCVLGTAKEHELALEKQRKQEEAMQRAVKAMMKIVPNRNAAGGGSGAGGAGGAGDGASGGGAAPEKKP